MSELITPSYVDRRLFSLHEEEDLVEITPHRRQVVYLETSLRLLFPERFVGANIGVYWVPGQFRHPWAGPDIMVAARSPRGDAPRVWVVWEDGPLEFVGEVASNETRAQEARKRDEIYRDALAVPEYLYIDLDRHRLELWRLEAGVYQRVRAERGRFRSKQLGVQFAWDTDREFVRIWGADGRRMPTAEELLQERQEAEERAAHEARQRQTAEERAEREARQRREAEARAAALAAELERLRRGGS